MPSQNETVIVPECHIYESELFEDSFFDDHRRNQPAIREVASNTVQVARADFVFGWIGDGSTNLTAYDLDDGCWYVLHEYSEGDTWLLAIVPNTCAAEGCREAQCQWLREIYSDVFSTSLTAMEMNEPWFLRQLVDIASEWEEDWWETLEHLHRDADLDNLCLTWWLRAVEAKTPAEASPPGLADGPDGEPFDSWLDRVSLRWCDTGEVLTRLEARRLRVVCQHLAQVVT